MSTPIVIVELRDNVLEAIYSNTGISILIVNRDPEEDHPTLSGPFEPTLGNVDLTRIFEDLSISAEILNTTPVQPYF